MRLSLETKEQKKVKNKRSKNTLVESKLSNNETSPRVPRKQQNPREAKLPVAMLDLNHWYFP